MTVHDAGGRETSDRPADGLVLHRHVLPCADGRDLFIYGDVHGTVTSVSPAPEPVALHKRLDRLTGAWIAVSPARNERPYSGQQACPFCPGGAEIPFDYDAAVLENRFPVFAADPPEAPDDPLVAPAVGRCEVVLYTARHDGSLATLSPPELARVIAVWRDRTAALWADPRHAFVLVFENRGETVGATLSHPHGQIYAFDHLPPLIGQRVAALRAARAQRGERVGPAGCLTCDVVARDDAGPRVVAANPSFSIAVPFAARWPYEVHVRARRHGLSRLADLEPGEQRDLAAALRQVVTRYDEVFDFELPYMMATMEAPASEPDWHLAFEFYPPHRTSRLTKVRASVETATGLFLNDTLPEERARELAELPGPAIEESPAPSVEAALD
jgi:UDPglucose--hexose-1-phosphate uridylyltransferase